VEQDVAVPHVVTRAVPATLITEAVLPPLATKFAPFTSRLKLPAEPANALAGKSCRISGALGLVTTAVMVTPAVPIAAGAAMLVAWMVTFGGDGTMAGAEYIVESDPAPEEFVIVPTVEFPPMIPFTSQVTAVFVEPETCAVKAWLVFTVTFEFAGATVTVIVPAGLIVTLSDAALLGSAAGVAATATEIVVVVCGAVKVAFTPLVTSVPHEVQPLPAMRQEIAVLGFAFAANANVAA
jgi:hypothetical protein